MSRRNILLSEQAHHRLVSQCCVRAERQLMETREGGTSSRESALAIKGRQYPLKDRYPLAPFDCQVPPCRQQVIAGPWNVNNIVAGINFPKVPDEMIHNIIYENWKRELPEYVP